MCGATRLRTFFTVTLKLMLPALTGATILSFMRGIENFESPLFFGSPANIHVITTEIYNSINQRSPPEYQYATAISFVIMALMFLIVLLQWGLLRGRSFPTVTGKGYSPAVMKLGKWRWVTFAFCVLFFVITVVLPVGQLLIGSFFKFFGFYEWDMLTLDHYRAVFGSSEFWRGFRNTMLLGLMGATVTMVLGGIVAYISVRTRWRGRRLIDAMAWLPWMMPGIVLGVGFLWAFALLPHADPDLRHDLGAAARLYLARHAAVGAGDVERLCSVVVRSRGMLARPWRKLAADDVAHPDRAGLAVLCGRLGAGVLRHHARAQRFRAALLGRLRGAVGRAAEAVGERQAEQVSVIGLMMMVMVIVFRWVQLQRDQQMGRRVVTARGICACLTFCSKRSAGTSAISSPSTTSICASSARRVRHPARPVRLRQDHDAAHGGGA